MVFDHRVVLRSRTAVDASPSLMLAGQIMSFDQRKRRLDMLLQLGR
jgi:hypothetical protein